MHKMIMQIKERGGIPFLLEGLLCFLWAAYHVVLFGNVFLGFISAIVAVLLSWLSFAPRERPFLFWQHVFLSLGIIIYLWGIVYASCVSKTAITFSNTSIAVVLVFVAILCLAWCLARLNSLKCTNTIFAFIGSTKGSGMILAGIMAGLFVWFVIQQAWVCDDAYITFRTIVNALDGYGLTWNIAERVQTYTHPLWMLLILIVSVITREVYFTSIVLGLLLSLATLSILLLKLSKNQVAGIIALMILTFSKSFMDWTTSGLENSLSYFIVILFYWRYLTKTWDCNLLLQLSLVACLGTLTRMDLILIFLPALVMLCRQLWRRCSWQHVSRALVIGFMPFIIWECFSLFYYGFPFPNTAYAKLGGDVPVTVYFYNSIIYFMATLFLDPLTGLIIVLGVIHSFVSQDKKQMFLGLGLFLYLLYIVKIGGDFMGSRFLSLPFLGALSLLIHSCRFSFKMAAGVLFSLVLLTLVLPTNPWISRANYENMELYYGIADERGYYYEVTGMLPFITHKGKIDRIKHPFSRWKVLAQEAAHAQQPVLVHGAMGAVGFYSGPNVHIIDELALCDPLLARLPAMTFTKGGHRIGHYKRCLPIGYVASCRSGKNSIKNKGLSIYYEKLRLITRGSLFTWQRLKCILFMNFGLYNHLISQKIYKRRERKLQLILPINEDDYFEKIEIGKILAKNFREYDPAISLWEGAYHDYPDRPEAIANLAIMYRHLGEMEKAMPYYKLLLTQFPKHWHELWFIYKKEIEEELGQAINL